MDFDLFCVRIIIGFCVLIFVDFNSGESNSVVSVLIVKKCSVLSSRFKCEDNFLKVEF